MDAEDPEWKNNILWSDEAIFSLSDTVNKHNCVYWAPINPNQTIDIQQAGEPFSHGLGWYFEQQEDEPILLQSTCDFKR